MIYRDPPSSAKYQCALQLRGPSHDFLFLFLFSMEGGLEVAAAVEGAVLKINIRFTKYLIVKNAAL
jgi:hypothetical protein